MEKHAEGPDVASRVRISAAKGFRCHVCGRAGNAPGVDRSHGLGGRHGVTGTKPTRQAEVHDFRLARVGNHHVARLEVTVHDPARMRVRQRIGNLHAVSHCGRYWQALPGNSVRQRTALYELHDDEIDPVVVLDFINRADVRVIEGGGGAGFLAEAFQLVGIARDVVTQHLDGNRPRQAWIVRAVDPPDATSAE